MSVHLALHDVYLKALRQTDSEVVKNIIAKIILHAALMAR